MASKAILTFSTALTKSRHEASRSASLCENILRSNFPKYTQSLLCLDRSKHFRGLDHF